MIRVVVSPEARQWVEARALAGASRDDIMRELLAAGWQKPVAAETLRVVLTESVKARVAISAYSTVGKMPEPDLANSPLWVDAGDRRVRVLLAMREPRLVVFGDLLSPEECAGLMAQAEPRMKRSETVDRKTGGVQVDAARTSRGMFFHRGENELTIRIEQRIAKLLNWPAENGEGLQILNYKPGAEYEQHYDYFDPTDAGTPAILKHGGQRVASLIMYLNTPERGGATTFPDVNLEVMPQQGNAVFFSYDEPTPATKTLHAGAPVVAGEKWIATKWLRERVFG
jgi:prolyl 4-hydroxylase